MRNRLCLIVLLAACVVLPCCSSSKVKKPTRRADSSGSDPKHALAAKYTQGTYDMSMNMDANIRVGEPAQQNMKMKMLMDFGMQVADIPGGAEKNVVMEFRRLKLDSPQGSFDSASGGSDPRTAALADVIGKKIEVAISPDGKNARMIRNGLAGVAGANSEQILTAIREVGDLLPDGPVGPGAVWHVTLQRDVPNMGKLPVEVEMELVSVKDTPEGKIANMKLTGFVEQSPNSVINGATFERVAMRLEGQMDLNLDTSMPIRYDVNLTGEFDVRLPRQSKSTRMDMDATMSMTTKAR